MGTIISELKKIVGPLERYHGLRYTEVLGSVGFLEGGGDAGDLSVNGVQSRQRRTVHYKGQVQGVGFRFTTERIAGRFAVDGFVKNLPDGRVLVVVEGEAKELDRFLAEIQAQMAVNIRTVAVEPGEPSGEFSGFGVRY